MGKPIPRFGVCIKALRKEDRSGLNMAYKIANEAHSRFRAAYHE